MDNSQRSDIFSISPLYSSKTMDATSYRSLVCDTKAALNKDITTEVNNSSFSTYFKTVLEDSGQCVSQSLNSVTGLLDDESVELSMLCDHIEDVINILQLLGSFLKNLVEAVSLKCSNMKTFPVTTGQILVTVFTHCKESELLYGRHLSSLQTQLKNLFKTCHELQLIYLMILEKHFIFDLTQTEEEDILLEALNLNLTIGEIVESLDLKTMAEQWKAYTMICEKYSSNVVHNIVFENCTGSLSKMVLKNVKSALEENQEQKVVLRSLKVSNFVIKILIKMCQALKNGAMRSHHHLVHLLINIYTHNAPYLLHMKKPAQLVHLFSTNVVSAADSLVSELLNDEGFSSYLLLHDPNNARNEDYYLGYIFLITSVMTLIIQRNDDISELWLNMSKRNLIHSLFDLVHNSHTWFNLSLKISSPADTNDTNGLYEHLLTNAVSLAATFDQEQYSGLERKMLEAILGTDCCSALFAADLWVLLARMSDSQQQLTVDQLTSLCQLYQKLDKNPLFAYSPQETHLSKIIEMLFKVLEKEEKIRKYQKFSINDDSNLRLWTVIKLRNLPLDVQRNAEEVVFKKLKVQFGKLSSSTMSQDDMECLIIYMKLVATCTFMKMDTIEEEIIKAWLQACPKSNQLDILLGDLCAENMWFLEYLTALFSLTESMIPVLQRNTDGLLKVLHVAAKIVSSGNLEAKLISLNLIFKLALYNSPDNTFKNQTDVIFHQVYRELFNETDAVFKNKLYDTCRIYYNNMRVKDIIHKVVSEDPTLERTWHHFIEHGTLSDSKTTSRDQLNIITDFHYKHKCLHKNYVIDLCNSEPSKQQSRSGSDNFEFADMEMIFSFESDTEQPASKKLKLEINEVESIIKRLENDTELLTKVKENISLSDYTNRLLDVCEKLKNIVT